MAQAAIITGDGKTLTQAVAGFCVLLREQGFTVGIAETLDALEVARLGTLHDRAVFRTALRTLLCINRQEFDQFSELFDSYWIGDQSRRRAVRQTTFQRPGLLRMRQLMVGVQAVESEAPQEDSLAASATERLLRTDFSNILEEEQERLEELAQRLFRLMSRRLSRRRKAAMRQEQIDLRRTIRRSIPHGGVPLALAWRARQSPRPHIAALLDVSASMDRYSFFLLHFVKALARYFGRVDAFLFSTRLRCITEELHTVKPVELASASDHWRSGTRIGACFATFNDRFGHRALRGDTVVLILSDGLDTGEPEALGREVRRIKQRARKLFWLSPLLGMEDYAPLTRGIRSVLPHVDAFLPAHNLDSLLQLETHLRHA